MSKFNEDSRVKIPALLHLIRLGYRYLSLTNAHWDGYANIFPALFEAATSACWSRAGWATTRPGCMPRCRASSTRWTLRCLAVASCSTTCRSSNAA